MDIFKVQSKKEESTTDTQRVCMEAAQAIRVVVDEPEQTKSFPSEDMMIDYDELRTTKEIGVYYPSNNATTKNGAPAIISKD